MAIEKSLVSGSMTMLILKLLSEKDMYGYEMIDTLRQPVCYVNCFRNNFDNFTATATEF